MNFRRAVIRLLLFTGFLLFIAWMSLKLMQYRGDWERLIHDIENCGRSVIDRAKPAIDAAKRFIDEHIAPMVENATRFIQEKATGIAAGR